MLGAIADDFTGATDLATMLRRSGHAVLVIVGDADLTDEQLADTDAVVVALKTRTAPRASAVADALAALKRLQVWGVNQIYFKYCSTFDSTDDGNIGPVLDALTDTLDVERCVVVPSLPENGRTLYQGHLFVGSDLLAESSMRHHPLTPMTRSRVADLLAPQTIHSVGEIHLDSVRAGEDQLRLAIAETVGRYLVVDAIDDGDLAVIGAAVSGHSLVSGGSGLALGLPGPRKSALEWRFPAGRRGAVLSGSLSAKTTAQLAHAKGVQPLRAVGLRSAEADGTAEVEALVAWASPLTDEHPVICSVRDGSGDSQGRADLVEWVLAEVAARLVSSDAVDALVVAGGETSGAVVGRLGVTHLQIGPELAPGVCWSQTEVQGRPLALALKSGNFGADDLFSAAWGRL